MKKTRKSKADKKLEQKVSKDFNATMCMIMKGSWKDLFYLFLFTSNAFFVKFHYTVDHDYIKVYSEELTRTQKFLAELKAFLSVLIYEFLVILILFVTYYLVTL